jgi:putative nucleotidyltransferase with HDIG domain
MQLENQNQNLADQMAAIVVKRVEADRLVLPTLPVAADKCLQLMRDPDVNLKTVARTLERDPLLAARVLRASNAAAFGGQSVSSIEAAVARMGVQKLKVMLIDASARKVFESRDTRIAEAFRQLWEHSLAVALLARDIAALCSAGDPDIAYLAGLLHDVGKPVLGAMMLEAEKMVVGSRPGATWISAAAWLAGVQKVHRQVGMALAEHWQLPDLVRKTIAESSEYDSSNRNSPVNAVCFANALAKSQGFYPGVCDVDDANALLMIGRSLLGIEEEPVMRLCATLKERIHSDA